MFKFYSLSLLFNPVLLSRDSPRVLIFCLPVQVRCLLLVHKVEQIKFRLLQVNFVRVQGSLIIVFDCLSTLINNSPFFKKKVCFWAYFIVNSHVATLWPILGHGCESRALSCQGGWKVRIKKALEDMKFCLRCWSEPEYSYLITHRTIWRSMCFMF